MLISKLIFKGQEGRETDISEIRIAETKDKYAAISNYLVLYPVTFRKMEQVKLFFLMLTQVNYATSGNSNFIALYHEDIIRALGVKRTSANRSFYIKTALEQMRRDCLSSWIDVVNDDIYRELPLIGEKGAETGISYIEINRTMLEQHLEGFYERKVLYHKIWVNDIFAMGNRSMMTFNMYMKLVTSADRKKKVNQVFFTTRQLKSLFGIAKGKYVDAKGHFKRTDFEKKTVEKVLKEIDEKCSAVEIITGKDDGKTYFEKVKKGATVVGYSVSYRIKDMQPSKEKKETAQAADMDSLVWIDNETENEFTVDELKRIEAAMATLPDENLPQMNEEIISRDMQKSAYLRNAYLKMRHYGPADGKRCGYLCKMIEADAAKKPEKKKRSDNWFNDYEQHDYNLGFLSLMAKAGDEITSADEPLYNDWAREGKKGSALEYIRKNRSS